MSEPPNLFEHVFRQPPTTKRANDENLATEITAYFLDACQPFRSRFLGKIDSSLAGLEWQPVVTQKVLSSPSGSALRWHGSRPDLFLSCLSPKVIVIVEVKIDAVTTGGADITQMTCYEEYLQHEFEQQQQENVFLATLTRWAPDQWLKAKNMNVPALRFSQVAKWLDDSDEDLNESNPGMAFLCKQWAGYLRHKGWATPETGTKHIDAIRGFENYKDLKAWFGRELQPWLAVVLHNIADQSRKSCTDFSPATNRIGSAAEYRPGVVGIGVWNQRLCRADAPERLDGMVQVGFFCGVPDGNPVLCPVVSVFRDYWNDNSEWLFTEFGASKIIACPVDEAQRYIEFENLFPKITHERKETAHEVWDEVVAKSVKVLQELAKRRNPLS